MILYALYAITFILLAYIPRNKLKEASLIFLFQLFVTWFLGLLTVELRLIEYPVREFSHVNRTSFLYEFLLYPVLSIFFCLYYPKNRKWPIQLLYIILFSAGLTLPEVIIEKNTHLIHYIHWKWYFSWLSISCTLFLTWLFYKWFYKLFDQ